MKVIGLMLTWNNLEFFKRSVHQALNFCDELIVVEGCHSKIFPKRSTDGTCEYIETIRNLPKLRVKAFDFKNKYNIVQCLIRSRVPKTSEFYKEGNWVFHWDDDYFFMEEELPILRAAMEAIECDSVNYVARNFIYNFKFNSIKRNFAVAYRIIDDLYLSGVSNAHYKNGKRFSSQFVSGVTLFHYNYVKKPERMKARFVMSIEKGTKASEGRYERWMGVKWDKDEDIFKSKSIVEEIRPGEGLHIYKGEHPEAVADHPWRHIKDVREME